MLFYLFSLLNLPRFIRVLSQPLLHPFVVPPPCLFSLVLIPMSLKVALLGAIDLAITRHGAVAHRAAMAVNIFNDGDNGFGLPQRPPMANYHCWLDNASSF